MKDLALALHRYSDNHPRAGRTGDSAGQLPPGTIPNPPLAPDERLSWFVELLPYLEHEQCYRSMDRHARWDAADNESVVRTPLREVRCADWDREGQVQPGYLTPYIGVAGVGPDAPFLPGKDRRAGIFGYDRQTAFEDITDGTSNTLMILESTRDNGPWAEGGPATVRGLDPADTPYLGTGRPFGGTHFDENTIFRHARSIGCYGAMADGSVRFMKEDISPEVLQALATKAGGDDVHGDDWWQ